MLQFPAVRNCGIESDRCLEGVAIPERFVSIIEHQATRTGPVSTAVIAFHLQSFFDAAAVPDVVEFCCNTPAPLKSITRPIAISTKLFTQLGEVAKLSDQSLEDVILKLLAHSPRKLCEEP